MANEDCELQINIQPDELNEFSCRCVQQVLKGHMMSKYTGKTYEKTTKGQDTLDLVVDAP